MSLPLTKVGISYTETLQEVLEKMRVIGSIELETYTKILRNLSEKLGFRFPLTTLGYSMVRIACLDDPLSGILALEASPVEGQSLQQNDQQRIKKER